MFWKKKKSNLVVQCPDCEWSPDGDKHWGCTCGHLWNTFETKGKCPKCKTQWEETRCPGCASLTPHKAWYKTPEEIVVIENSVDPTLRSRKKSLESRLVHLGIKNYRIGHLSTLDNSQEEFQNPYEAGCRLLCLYAVSQAAQQLQVRTEIIDWLKKETLWGKLSPNEQDFLIELMPDERTTIDFSWHIESALTLAWCLGKVPFLPALDQDQNEEAFEIFFKNIPAPGESTELFLTSLIYIDMAEIYEENRLNEMATTYFRDLLFNGKKDETKIDRGVSLRRHTVLNWLRKCYPGFEEAVTGESWDETDTST